MYIDRNDALNRGETFRQKPFELLRSLLQLLSSEEQSFWIFILSAHYSLLQACHAIAENQPAGLQHKKIEGGSTLRIEEPIELSVTRGSAAVCVIGEKIPVQVHVV